MSIRGRQSGKQQPRTRESESPLWKFHIISSFKFWTATTAANSLEFASSVLSARGYRSLSMLQVSGDDLAVILRSGCSFIGRWTSETDLIPAFGVEEVAGLRFGAPRRRITETQNDLERISSITHRDRAASRTLARPNRIMVGGQRRLDASVRICPAGRRTRGVVGARLFASQGRRSGQCRLLVQSGGEPRLQGATGCGMGQHCGRLAAIDRPSHLEDLRVGSSVQVSGSPRGRVR